jgi:hypothetical protein
MSIPAHDVSDAAVHTAAVSAWAGEAAELIALIESSTPERQLLVLAKLARPENAPTTDSQTLNFAQSLITLTNLLDDSDSRVNALDSVLSLLARQFTSLPTDFRAESIWSLMTGLSQAYRRIRLLDFVGYTVDDRPLSTFAWVDEVNASMVAEAMRNFVANLTARDDASTSDAIGYQLHFALRRGAEVNVAAEVRRLIEHDRIELEDLAARLVSTSSIAGLEDPHWRLHEADQGTFDRLAPSTDDPWYNEPAIDVDLSDLSWQNKRTYARGRFKRPPASESMAEGSNNDSRDDQTE